MDRSSSCMFLLPVCLLLHLVLVKCKSPVVPALYVFGDSLVDTGNNNFLQSEIKVNHKPYGVDFPGGTTGRFSNGKTALDLLCDTLGLPYICPYLSLLKADKKKIITGVNYASGSAGILRETGSALGQNLCMDDQIEYFQGTLSNELPSFFKTQAELSDHLSQSLFVISVGSNDYINNYLQPMYYNSSKIYDDQQYGDFLLHGLEVQLTKLYNLGARKFILYAIGTLGCLPALTSNSQTDPISQCVEEVNKMVKIFNVGLLNKITELSSTLHDSIFIPEGSFEIMYAVYQNPSKYGFSARQSPCCVIGPYGLCLPDQEPCKDRSKHLFLDLFHPTQELLSFVLGGFSNASFSCAPMDTQQLMKENH